eukprot:4191551-Prymnesium_polylepis.1
MARVRPALVARGVGQRVGPGLHFPKSFKKSDALAGKKKFSEIVRSWPGSRYDEEIFEKCVRSNYEIPSSYQSETAISRVNVTVTLTSYTAFWGP